MSIVEHKKYIKLGPSNYEVWKSVILKYVEYSYPNDLKMVTKSIQANLDIKFCPTKFREGNIDNPMFGHCYHSNQALYYFFKNANLKAMSAPCDVAGQHWWCEDVDGNIIALPWYMIEEIWLIQSLCCTILILTLLIF